MYLEAWKAATPGPGFEDQGFERQRFEGQGFEDFASRLGVENSGVLLSLLEEIDLEEINAATET